MEIILASINILLVSCLSPYHQMAATNELDCSDNKSSEDNWPGLNWPEIKLPNFDFLEPDSPYGKLPISCFSDMAEDKVIKFRRVAITLHSSFTSKDELRPLYEAQPFIIVMKGDPITARKLIAFCVASILKCPLVKKDDFDKSDENPWRKMCKLALSQVMLGHSTVIDTELASQNEFDLLKELTEITKTPLAVFDCRVDNADKLWKSLNVCEFWGRNPAICLLSEFMERNIRLQYINSTNLDMGEIPAILVETKIQNLNRNLFETALYHALMDYQSHVFLDLECQKANDCDHIFEFTTIEDEYKRRCFKCRQLVSGSVYCCSECRFIVHRTCSYFPESLPTDNITVDNKRGPGVTLNLRHVVPELAVDVRCTCCKQLLRDSTSSLYYDSNTGLSFFGYSIYDSFIYFDLDCLFLLPAEKITKLHEHKLKRYLYMGKQKMCKECDAVIGYDTICYCCDTCDISFDVFCLWLPETAEFNRHRHTFKLTVVPRLDPYPYYCEVCQNERDTERLIYYCAECDFPIHPRCIVETACLPRYSSTEVSKIKKEFKEALPDSEFQSSSSHLSTEKVMAKELPWRQRSDTKELALLFKEIILPIIVTTKGHSMGRKLFASTLAAGFDCLLIDEDSLCEVTHITNESKQVCCQEFSRITLSQLQIGLSVVIDCDLSHESEFFLLRNFALDIGTPLLIVDCKPCDEDELEDFHGIVTLRSDYKYMVGDIPKIFVNLRSTPTFDDVKKYMPEIIHSFSAYIKKWSKEHTKKLNSPYCYRHPVNLRGIGLLLPTREICNKCSNRVSTPFLKCITCDLVLHKTCTKFPDRIMFYNVYTQDTISNVPFDLEKYGDDNVKVRCACCHSLVKGNAYTHINDDGSLVCVDFDCLFTTQRLNHNLHKHRLELSFVLGNFFCQACGSACQNTFCYRCDFPCNSFKISVNCGLLKETERFGRHRHPFHLAISPKHDLNQYYCEVCQEERDKDHWIYYCEECEFLIHIHCCVPTGGCRRLES